MFLKPLFQGRLDFGTENSYDKVAKMFSSIELIPTTKNEIILSQRDIL